MHVGFHIVHCRYVVSLPLVVLIVLASRRNRLFERRVKYRFGFLYGGFTKRFFWWEIWTMYRKALTIMLAVFLRNYGTNSNLQVLVGTMIVMGALAVQFFARPFARSEIDTLEEIGLISIYFAFFAGLFYLNIEEVRRRDTLYQGMPPAIACVFVAAFRLGAPSAPFALVAVHKLCGW